MPTMAVATDHLSSALTICEREGTDGQAFQRRSQRRRDRVSPGPGPYTQPIAPEGTPSVLYIVLDDVGFSAMEPFGGMIETPNINRIAERGLLYRNFHTTAL